MNTDHLHALSVHFPIALLMVGFLFDFFALIFKKEHCLSKAGFWLMILGSIAAVAAYLTGEYFSRTLAGPLGEKKEVHELFAKITMWVMVGLSVIRIILVLLKKEKSGFKWLIILIYLCGAGLVGYTGLLGGSLVYDHMLESPVSTDSLKTDSIPASKTAQNLISAIEGETTASAKYFAFAEKAKEEGYSGCAALFTATAEAEKVHIRNLTKSLATLNIKPPDFKPVFSVGSTKENLAAALSGETEENTRIYPEFIAQADSEKMEDAAMAFGYVMEVEGKHLLLFKAAIETGTPGKKAISYSVCPVCGLIYETTLLPAECELCGTPKKSFTAYQ
jgi:rubrerythrin/uncharacterized membrane protein